MVDLKQIIEEFEKSEKEAGVPVGKWLWLDLQEKIRVYKDKVMDECHQFLSELPDALRNYENLLNQEENEPSVEGFGRSIPHERLLDSDQYPAMHALALEIAELRIDDGTLEAKMADLWKVVEVAMRPTSIRDKFADPYEPSGYATLINKRIEKYRLITSTEMFLESDFFPMLRELKEGRTPTHHDLLCTQNADTFTSENENVLSAFIDGSDAFKANWRKFISDVEAAITEKLPQSLGDQRGLKVHL